MQSRCPGQTVAGLTPAQQQTASGLKQRVRTLQRALDAEMKVSAEKILVPHLVLEKLQVEIRLQDGALALKPLRAVIGGGTLDGVVNLRAEGKEGALISVFKIDHFDAGSFLKEFGVTYPFEGKVDMLLDVQGKGNSIATLMAGLSGKTQTILNKGRLDRRYIDLLGAGVSGHLLRLLNPLKQQAANVELNCFVNAFDITWEVSGRIYHSDRYR